MVVTMPLLHLVVVMVLVVMVVVIMRHLLVVVVDWNRGIGQVTKYFYDRKLIVEFG